MRTRCTPPLVAAVLLLALSVAGLPARAQADPRMFGQTGYRIDNDDFWSYFQSRGQVNTFGFPVSRAFPFLGCTTQFFQRLVMQRCGGGGVQTLNLLDEGLLPYTTFNGSVVPAPDAQLKSRTPSAEAAGYGAAILDFVRANAPDTFEGEPVNSKRRSSARSRPVRPTSATRTSSACSTSSCGARRRAYRRATRATPTSSTSASSAGSCTMTRPPAALKACFWPTTSRRSSPGRICRPTWLSRPARARCSSRR
jgi:hypothetical protein